MSLLVSNGDYRDVTESSGQITCSKPDLNFEGLIMCPGMAIQHETIRFQDVNHPESTKMLGSIIAMFVLTESTC